MSEYTIFPKELERSWFGDLDKLFSSIFFLTLILCVAMVLSLQGIKWQEMTQAEVDQYLERVYRVTAPKVERPTPRIVTTLQEAGGEVTEVTQEPTAPTEGVARPGAKRRGSSADMAARRSAMQESARSLGIFRLAGARGSAGGAGSGGTGGSGVARGLKSGGGLGGVEVGKIAGIATGSTADKVERARGGGRITEGTGGLDIATLSDAQIDEILSASTVAVPDLPEVQGLAAKEVNRSSGAIKDVANNNMHMVKNCYNKYKRKDLNLKGKIKVEWTIQPSGRVDKVRIVSSQWTNASMGRRVEDCIKDVIMTWLFDPVDEAAGTARAQYSYIFD
ncbi:MAG: AgmX/PglI C-terminal domain-containing protein [bacterium]|nr:AgmX/PglI C-terminal domain-containing protein [bacterium]